jgi:hypothetical protein
LETGSNKSLFTLIAVVIFGVFLSLSYWLFQDELKSVLATVLADTRSSINIKMDYEGQYPTDEAYFTIVSTGSNTCKITSYDLAGGTDVIIPKEINGLTVTALGNKAFYDKGLTSVKIPDTIITLDNGSWTSTNYYGVFAKNNLKELIIPNSVVTIGSQAFFNAGDLEGRLILGESVSVIGNDAFIDNNITKLRIPKSVVKISWHSFGENKIEDLMFVPDSLLTTIENSAFNGNKITNLELPKSLTKVEAGSFTSNPLKSVTVKSGVILNGKLAKDFHWVNYGFDSYYDSSIIHYY